MKRKICSKCKIDKPISEFYKNCWDCKICRNKRNKKWQKINKDKVKEYRKKWLSNPKNEDKARKCDKKYQAKKRALGLINKTEEYRIWREEHRKECNAEQLVNYYIKIGKIKKGKCKCGAINVYAHHDDYNKPLKVRWMCPSCHKKFHLGILVGNIINNKIKI